MIAGPAGGAWRQVGDGPPLVFLHGYGAHSRFWNPWVPRLTHRYRCVLVDLPGFGEAPAPRNADYSPTGLASAVVALIRELDLRQVTLVGHSLGGGVALLAALDLLDDAEAGGPQRLAGFVSVAGAAYRQHEPPFVRIARSPILSSMGFALLPKRFLVRTALRAIVARPEAVTEERVDAYARPMRSARRRRAFLRCARRIVPPDLDRVVARIPEIDVPALCLWGRQDRVVPLAVGHRLARELPRGRLRIIEDCGHQVVEEHPDTSLGHLQSFLDGDEGPQFPSGSDGPPSRSDVGDSEGAGSKPGQRRMGRGG